MNNNLYEWCLENNKKNLIDEFDSNKNTNDISFFTYGTRKKVWWRCSKCNHSWEATIYHRTKRNQG